MYGDLFEDGVVLFQFQAIRCILPVLLGDIPAGARHSRCLVLRAFQDDLVAVAF